MTKWKIEFTKKSQKQIDSLDNAVRMRIKKAIEAKLEKNPELSLEPLLGETSGYYKFRIGDYRLICYKDKERLVVLVLKIGHRKHVYH